MRSSRLGLIGPIAALALSAYAGDVTAIRATHRDGQTFVTWRDVAEGAAGASNRYAVYRSDAPITAANVARAEPCARGILNNSARLFGSAFNPKDRIDTNKPRATLEAGGAPQPDWSGLTVVTTPRDRRSYYAVVATAVDGSAPTPVVPGQSATTEPVEEKVAPLQPILLWDSKHRDGPYIAQTCVSGKTGLPMRVDLHASSGQGGGAGSYGDYYLYYSRPEWGYVDGLPGVFSVEESRIGGDFLLLRSRDCIVNPNGNSALETYWFGYACVPQWADHAEPRAYPFTERRMLWVIDWVMRRYQPDPERITCGGGSMGAWGSSTFAFRHPEIFAAVYPNRPRTRQRGLPGLAGRATPAVCLMDDGQTRYTNRMDMVAFAREHHADLPFLGWCCGRRDGFASWQEQVDMVRAMTEAHHGFAFAWNDGDHSSGAAPMAAVVRHYPADRFARNRSYPAFGHSSIDANPGNGDPKDGDMEGGINLGFGWADVVDEAARWEVTLSNVLATAEMTVDVTPRRGQQFKPAAGAKIAWTAGDARGDVAADAWGLVTVPKVALRPGQPTRLSLRAP